MSLKGYQWLNDKGEVVMSFTFKDLTIDIWQDVELKEYHDFIEYIRHHDFEPMHTDQHFHKIVGLL